VRAWVLLVLLGCQQPASEVLEVWHAYENAGAEQQALEEVGRVWSAQTGIPIDIVSLPYGAFRSKLETAIPRGNGPDAFVAAHDGLGKWVAMDLLEGQRTPLDGHLSIAQDAMHWEGECWGWPMAYKSILLLYDPTRVSKPPQTTDELIEMARARTKEGNYGLAYEASTPYYHGAWAHGFGAYTVPEEGLVRLDDPRHEAAYAFSKRLMVDEGILPLQPTAELVGTLYREGKTDFVISGPWFISSMERPVAAAPLPIISETGERARPFLTVDGIFVVKGAKDDRAARFAEFVAGPQGAEIRQSLGRQAVSWSAQRSSDPLLLTLAQQAEDAVLLPSDPNVDKVFEAQARGLRGLARGALTPKQAAADAQAYYTILSRPAPPAVSPVPYLLALVLGLGGALWLWVRQLRSADMQHRLRKHARDYLWILPASLAMFTLVLVPFLTGAAVALFAHDQGDWTFVGLSHFLDILLSRDWPIGSPLSFLYTLGVTVLWTLTNVAAHVVLGVGLALVLREPWIRMRGVWRALLILPWAIPNYITALIWKGMFHAQYGAINALMGLVLLQDRPVELDWFGSFATAFCANLATNTWLGFPFMMVVTLGALQAIPRELEEAAEVDGANAWLRFRHVTWPLLQPALLPAIILGSVWTFNMFNVVYLVSAGEPNSSTEILISEAYRWAFSRGHRYGYAAAYAVLIFGVLFAYSRAANRVAGRRVL
jgi:arabinogalactan oligomer/maltooligosaccharide transport system permease protein